MYTCTCTHLCVYTCSWDSVHVLDALISWKAKCTYMYMYNSFNYMHMLINISVPIKEAASIETVPTMRCR